MTRPVLICLAAFSLGSVAFAQAPATLGDSAKALVGTWEFSNADRDKICTVTFKADPAPGGFKLEFDKNCGGLFPLVNDIVSWNFPDNDLLHLLDAQGKSRIDFSEVEDGIYEAPTPGVGVLFLQNSAAAAPQPKAPEQVAGNWAIVRGTGAPLCQLTLATNAVQEGMALTVKPGCDPAFAKLNLTSWRIDNDELLLMTPSGNPWRFEEVDANTWSRVPESADTIMLVRQ